MQQTCSAGHGKESTNHTSDSLALGRVNDGHRKVLVAPLYLLEPIPYIPQVGVVQP